MIEPTPLERETDAANMPVRSFIVKEMPVAAAH